VAATTAEQIADKTPELSTLPEVTMRIIQVVQDPRSTANDLHKIVRNDPALSARVLRVVNSAFYGLPGQIGSIDRAIMLLGLNAVKNIAIAASLAKMFKNIAPCDDLTGKDLWTHSVAVGAANKLITISMGLALPDEAFLAGLIHDIGLVVELQAENSNISDIVQRAKAGIKFTQAEEAVLGANHQEIGQILTQRWKFPRSFQYVTGFHHRPRELAQENRLLTVVTHISDVICSQKELGVCITVNASEPDPELVREIGLSAGKIEEISANLEEELETVRELIE
jgi:HD-like signal output (HDOD) protein